MHKHGHETRESLHILHDFQTKQNEFSVGTVFGSIPKLSQNIEYEHPLTATQKLNKKYNNDQSRNNSLVNSKQKPTNKKAHTRNEKSSTFNRTICTGMTEVEIYEW